MAELQLEILTAERHVLSTKVEYVNLSTVNGTIGILANHIPLLTALNIGVLEYGELNGKKRRAAIGGGFAEMNNNKLTVFASSAELAEEIDVLRAREAKRRAEQQLREHKAEWEYTRASVALEKALARLKAAEK